MKRHNWYRIVVLLVVVIPQPSLEVKAIMIFGGLILAEIAEWGQKLYER